MLNILLFGGSGFVGRNFINKYHEDYKIFSCGRTAISEKNEEFTIGLGANTHTPSMHHTRQRHGIL